MALEDENKIRLLGIVTGHQYGFFRISGTGSRIKLQTNCSLAAGRDCLVIPGNNAPSTGKDFLYVQDGFAGIPDTELMNKLSSLCDLSEVVGGFSKLSDRRLLTRRNGIGNLLRVSGGIKYTNIFFLRIVSGKIGLVES